MTMFDAVFGVHAGLQHTTADELRSVWQTIEDLGYGWISIWDHFYGATGHPDDAACLEAVAMHAALACSTERVRVGSLVYSICYRHPAVLAKAITTIDQLSGGRADMGIGAGWAQIEYQAYGIPFPEVRTRMDQLEEGIQCLRGLLHHEVTNFEGEWFTLTDARNEPRPLQHQLPIWIGGGGEKRTLRIAAQYADGWNVPFISPEQFAHKNAVLDEHCARRTRTGRDQAGDQLRTRLDRGQPAAAVRCHRRVRATRRAHRQRPTGDRHHRRLRRGGRRPGEHRPGAPFDLDATIG
ncbi:MAG: TIGR03560 family F420-dependent LLM class oxidoreductase [Ilumatobacteraceae bacterium]